MMKKQIASALLAFSITLPVLAVEPKHSLTGGALKIHGVGPDNPIIYDNDWWSDVFDNNYLWAQKSLGHANLKGNIVSLDMWEWQNGYKYKMEDCMKDATKALDQARKSGLKKYPGPHQRVGPRLGATSQREDRRHQNLPHGGQSAHRCRG